MPHRRRPFLWLSLIVLMAAVFGPPSTIEGSSAPPSAATLTWVSTGGPLGGLGYDIRYNFDNPNIWYVTDNYAGVHMSTDNGQTWFTANTGIPGQGGFTADARPIFSLTVDPHNPQIIWAGTDGTGHIYKSTDGGKSWVQKDNGAVKKYDKLTFRGFTVDPRSSDIVYAMAETGGGEGRDPAAYIGGEIFKTTDGGENWQSIWDSGIPGSLTRYLWINPQNPDVLYASTGIFDRPAIGENEGANPFGGLGVLKSTDGGKTWQVQGESNGLRMRYLSSLYMHPEQPDLLLAAAGRSLGPHGPEYIQGVVTAGGKNPGGIYRTTDGGEHWTQVLAGQTHAETFTVVEICPSHPNVAYAASEAAIYRSDDTGLNWRQTAGYPLVWGPPGITPGFPIDMQCDPRNPDRIFVNNYGGGNFLSEDGGRTWSNASKGYTGAIIRKVAVDPRYPGRVYAAGRSGLWRSDNGGADWQGILFGASNYKRRHFESTTVAVDPSRPDRILASEKPPAGVMDSPDGGATWTLNWPTFKDGELYQAIPIDGEITAFAFAPSDPQMIYAGTDLQSCALLHEPCPRGGWGVLVSRDGGTTWERATDTTIRNVSVIDLTVDPTDAKRVYAAGDSGLYRSTDGGATWSRVEGLPPGQLVRTVAISPTDRQRVLAALDRRGIFVSTDGGTTWKETIQGLEPNGSVHEIRFDPTDSQIVYLSDAMSGVYRSLDGGQNWQKINKGLVMRSTRGLAISADGNHLYAATDGGGVFRLDLNGTPPPAAPAFVPPKTEPTPPPPAVQPAFSDLPASHPAFAAVMHLVEHKVTSGYPDGTFRPEQIVTRAEFAKLLTVAIGRAPEPGAQLPFGDVAGHWAATQGYLQAAVAINAFGGFPDGSFRPDAPVTRAQVAKLVVVAAGVSPAGTPAYADIPADAWYAGHVAAAVHSGLFGSAAPYPVWTGERFFGEEPATRADVAMVLASLMALRQ